MRRFLPFLALLGIASGLVRAAVSPVYVSDLPYRSVRAYGAKGDGTTDDRTAIANAIAACGAGDTIYFAGGKTYRIGSNLTFPASVTLRFASGASLKRDANATVTFNGPIEAPACDILQGMTGGTGLYVFSPSAWTQAVPEWMGAVGDGSTDDATAIANYIALKPFGCKLRFLGKTYAFNSALSLNSMNNTLFQGEAAVGDSVTNSGTVFRFTGATATCVTIASARDLTFKNIQFRFCSAGTTGYLVSLQKINNGSDTSHIQFEDCSFMCDSNFFSNASAPAALVNTDGTHDVAFIDCNFYGGQHNITGKLTNTIGPTGGYAFNVHFNRCGFFQASVTSIHNPDQAWLIQNSVFEPLVSGAAGAMDVQSTFTANGVSFDACWMGDDVAGTHGKWISWAGNGLSLNGNWIGLNHGTTGVYVSANNCRGIDLFGNEFKGNGGQNTAIDFNTTTGHSGFTAIANSYESVATIVGGTAATGSFYSDGGTVFADTLSSATNVRASSLTVGSASLPNLLSADNARIEGSQGTWVTYAAGTITRSTSQAQEGSASLSLAATGTAAESSAWVTSSGAVPATPGATYYGLASFRAATMTNRVTVELVGWIADKSQTVILNSSDACVTPGSPACTSAPVDTTSGWTQVSVRTVVPNNVSWIGIIVHVGRNGGVVNGEVHYVDEVSISQNPSTTWAVPGPETDYVQANASGWSSTVAISSPGLIVQSNTQPNLLSSPNATLESGIGDWVQNTNATVSRTTAEAQQGSAALRMTAPAGGTEMSVTLNSGGRVAVSPGQRVYAMASLRAIATTEPVQIDLYGFDANGTVIGLLATSGSSLSDSTSTWTQVNAQAMIPAGCAMAGLVVRVKPGGMIAMSEVHDMDAVSITRDSSLVWSDPSLSPTYATIGSDGIVSAVPATFTALNVGPFTYPNLLASNDANFESSVGNWVSNNNATVTRTTGTFESGAAAMQLTSPAMGAEMSVNLLAAGGRVPVVVGTTYYALASFKASVTQETVQVDIDGYDAGGTIVGRLSTSGTSISDTTSGWTQVSTHVTVPGGVATLGLVLRVASLSGIAGSETHYVDQVSITRDASLLWHDPSFSSTYVTAGSGSLSTTVPIVMSVSAPPANAASAGTTGQIAWDAGFVYVYTGTGWKRAALSSW